MTNDALQALRTRLKSGEYNGADIMKAWLAIDRLIEFQRKTAEIIKTEELKVIKNRG